MSVIDEIGAAAWHVIARQVFCHQTRRNLWHYDISLADWAEIDRAVKSGTMLKCQRRHADGHFELVVKQRRKRPAFRILQGGKNASTGRG